MNIDMPDTAENRNKIVQFVAQEIAKDKIPHFLKKKMRLSLKQERATRKNSLTLKLRELEDL